MAQFEIRARLTHTARVLVEAEDEEAALTAFGNCEWEDDGMAAAELEDWEQVGNPREVG